MASSIGASSVTRPQFRTESWAPPSWAHPEVAYWFDTWRMIRDACDGEQTVKAQGRAYLPQLEGMDYQEYAAYLDRATYYPFTGKTAGALSGSIFRRRESITGLPDPLLKKLEAISKEKASFLTFSTLAAEEIIKMGRYGVLVDLPTGLSTTPSPYLCGYTAENIVDWESDEIEGRIQLVRVVLRESKLMRDPISQVQRYMPVYRQLILRGRDANAVYDVEIYESPSVNEEASIDVKYRTQVITPTNRGKTLNFIPFYVFGAFASTLAVEKAPLEDIARLNISHYRSYANLEHGRLFAGFPIYYVEAAVGSGETDAEFELGASKVWVTPPGAKPGLLELNGQGLKFLVEALDQKEQQAAALGGRMMGVRGTAVSESDNMLKLSERNEQSVLLKVTRSLDSGFTTILRWWATFQDITAAKAEEISVEYNKDFLFDGIGAREFRAVHAMYKDGVLPIEVVYHYLKKSMVIPDWMSVEEFKKLLDRLESFPNNVDIEARSEGWADAKSRDQAKLQGNLLDNNTSLQDSAQAHELDVLDQEQAFQEQQKVLDRKSAEKQAAITPKPVPGAPGGKPAPKPVPKQ